MCHSITSLPGESTAGITTLETQNKPVSLMPLIFSKPHN